ncbi:MAG: hypothetical protein ACRCYU_06865, partial [Nocardioides sp.]
MDVHGEMVLNSLDAMEHLVRRFVVREDPVAEMDVEFQGAVDELVARLENFDPFRLIEVARISYLPIAPKGTVIVTPEAMAAHVELLALVALAAAKSRGVEVFAPVEFQAMSKFASEAKGWMEDLFRLAQIRAVAGVDSTNKLAMIELLLRGSQV